MAIQTTLPMTDRSFVVKPEHDGLFLEIGTAGLSSQVGCLNIQFNPSAMFAGTFTVMAKARGQDAKDGNFPWLPVPYRRINVAGAASDWLFDTAAIAASGMIQVPANGTSIALLVGCTAGLCPVVSWDTAGGSAV